MTTPMKALGLFFSCMCMCGLLVGCDESPTVIDDAGKKIPVVTEITDFVDFVDNAKDYKGKVVTLKLRFRGDPNTLHIRNVGQTTVSGDCEFQSVGTSKIIIIRVNAEDPLAEFDSLDDLPNITLNDEVIVTFLCEGGSTEGSRYHPNHQSNRAIRIIRAK